MPNRYYILMQSLVVFIAAYALAAAVIYLWPLAITGAVIATALAGLVSVLAAFSLHFRGNGSPQAVKESLDPTLQIANQTLPFLRRGLNRETAEKTAEIIQKISDIEAVAITDREQVLAYRGVGSDHHLAGKPIMTEATKEVVQTGTIKIIRDGYGLDCPVDHCPLQSAVIVPLKCKGQVMGTLKLYQTKHGEISDPVVKLTVGVAQILGMQMELAEVDRQAQLVTKAELDALHAQINPHFLFNTLNTIIMFSRTNPETARRLLIRLATFFRHALKRHGHFNTLKEEIEYLNNYLILERARFREKLRINREIDKDLLDCQVPVLTIQPLVENAIKHGILPKPGRGTVHISISRHEHEMLIVVRDDGVGMSSEVQEQVLLPGFGSGNGVGMSNVHERLKGLYGNDYGLRIISVPGEGTSVYVRVPLTYMGSEKEVLAHEHEAKGTDSG